MILGKLNDFVAQMLDFLGCGGRILTLEGEFTSIILIFNLKKQQARNARENGLLYL